MKANFGLRNTAKKLADKGFCVCPVRVYLKTNGKRGLDFDGFMWNQDSSNSSDEVARMDWSNATHVWIAADLSKTIIADLDVKKGDDGIAEWRDLAEDPGGVPGLSTPSGGKHLFYKRGPHRFNSTQNNPRPGVDLRAGSDGGVLVHTDDVDHLPHVRCLPEFPLSALPAAKSNSASLPDGSSHRQLQDLIRADRGDPHDRNNPWLTSLAGHFAEFSNLDKAIDAVKAINNGSDVPILDEVVEEVVERFWRKDHDADEFGFRPDEDLRLSPEYRRSVAQLQARRLAERDFRDYLDQMEGDVEEFESVDLTQVEPEDDPGMDPAGLFYNRGKVWIAGAPGGGKTLLVRWLMLLHVRAGRVCAIYECEMGPADTAAKLLALGATPEELSKIKYYRMLGGGVADLTRHGKAIARRMKQDGATVLMYDAVAPLVMEAGLDEDKASDIRQFINRSANAVTEDGGLVYFIDHIGNNSEASFRPRGSSDKTAGTDMMVTLSTRKGESFAKGRSGKFTITVRKDRFGMVGKDLMNRVRVECGEDESIRILPGVWTAQLSEDEKDKISEGTTLTACLMELRERGPLTEEELAGAIGKNKRTIHESLRRNSTSDKPKTKRLKDGRWDTI